MDDRVVDKSNDVAKKNSIDAIRIYFSNLSPKAKIKTLIIVVLVACIVVIGINMSSTATIAGNNTETSFVSSGYYMSSIDYCNVMEQKLRNVLSNISGLGNVEVMISLDSSMELIYAESYDKVSNNSIFTENSEKNNVYAPIIIDNNGKEEPLIVKEILPKIKGVLIVCENIDSVSKKLNIIQSVQSLLDINISNIQVLSNDSIIRG